MRSVFLIVLLIGSLLLLAGLLALGAFPPEPHTKQIQKVLPNDRFVPHGG